MLEGLGRVILVKQTHFLQGEPSALRQITLGYHAAPDLGGHIVVAADVIAVEIAQGFLPSVLVAAWRQVRVGWV